MKSFAGVLAIAVLAVIGICHADERAFVMPQSEDVGAPSRPLKAVLSDFVGNQFVGSVVWHIDNIAAPGQPPTPVVRADIEIPDLGMTVRLDLRRNEDESLAASHIIELAFALSADFQDGRIANVPGVLMKAGETARGDTLRSVSVKVATNFFLIGLSSVAVDRQRNIQLLKERAWIDIAIAYSNGKRANIAIEKAALDDRALAVLEPQAIDAPISPVAPSSSGPKPNLPMLGRPVWSWPPGRSLWALMPGSPRPRPVLSEAIRIASTTVVTPLALKPPSWLRDISTMPIMATTMPPWQPVRRPDFRLPTGPSRFAGEKYLEPPSRFVRWSDRIETVLPIDEVGRRCRGLLGRLPSVGKLYRGCARGIAGRCFITRVDDPGVARHELAHCNGWKHPE